MRRKRAALITLFLLAALIGGTVLWLHAQRRQYALNRQLIAALVNGDDKQALALVNEGADPDTHYGPTLVPSLLDVFKQLFHRSASPVNESPTALMIACGANWNDIGAYDAQQNRRDDAQPVQAMLTHGAAVNVKDEYGRNALVRAVQFNRLNTVNVLLDYGTRVNEQDRSGQTPLISGCLGQAGLDLKRLLLEHGASANILDKRGATALFWEVFFNRDKGNIRLFLAYGANPNLGDYSGYTPLMLAQAHKRADLIALLRQAGARK